MNYQAENCYVSQGVVESNHAGWTGTGFVNGDNASGSLTTWVTATPVAYNGDIAPGHEESFGFNAAGTGLPLNLTAR